MLINFFEKYIIYFTTYRYKKQYKRKETEVIKYIKWQTNILWSYLINYSFINSICENIQVSKS